MAASHYAGDLSTSITIDVNKFFVVEETVFVAELARLKSELPTAVIYTLEDSGTTTIVAAADDKYQDRENQKTQRVSQLIQVLVEQIQSPDSKLVRIDLLTFLPVHDFQLLIDAIHKNPNIREVHCRILARKLVPLSAEEMTQLTQLIARDTVITEFSLYETGNAFLWVDQFIHTYEYEKLYEVLYPHLSQLLGAIADNLKRTPDAKDPSSKSSRIEILRVQLALCETQIAALTDAIKENTSLRLFDNQMDEKLSPATFSNRGLSLTYVNRGIHDNKSIGEMKLSYLPMPSDIQKSSDLLKCIACHMTSLHLKALPLAARPLFEDEDKDNILELIAEALSIPHSSQQSTLVRLQLENEEMPPSRKAFKSLMGALCVNTHLSYLTGLTLPSPFPPSLPSPTILLPSEVSAMNKWGSAMQEALNTNATLVCLDIFLPAGGIVFDFFTKGIEGNKGLNDLQVTYVGNSVAPGINKSFLQLLTALRDTNITRFRLHDNEYNRDVFDSYDNLENSNVVRDRDVVTFLIKSARMCYFRSDGLYERDLEYKSTAVIKQSSNQVIHRVLRRIQQSNLLWMAVTIYIKFFLSNVNHPFRDSVLALIPTILGRCGDINEYYCSDVVNVYANGGGRVPDVESLSSITGGIAESKTVSVTRASSSSSSSSAAASPSPASSSSSASSVSTAMLARATTEIAQTRPLESLSSYMNRFFKSKFCAARVAVAVAEQSHKRKLRG